MALVSPLLRSLHGCNVNIIDGTKLNSMKVERVGSSGMMPSPSLMKIHQLDRRQADMFVGMM
jgi:hypothetical protein